MQSTLSTVLALTSLLVAASASFSPCPFNYPGELNLTEQGEGLVFTLRSNNPLTNNRAVQLRPSATDASIQIAAIDAHSPVLLGQLRAGVLFAENRSIVNQLYDLGPTAFLTPASGSGNNKLYSFEFGNRTAKDGMFLLAAGGSTGNYNLYHQEPNEVVNGFQACQVDGKWWRIYYDTYTNNPVTGPNCEFVAVSVSR